MLKVNQLHGFGARRSSSGSVDANIVWVVAGHSSGLTTSTDKYNLGSGVVSSGAAINNSHGTSSSASDNASKAVLTHGYNAQTGGSFTNTTEKISLPSGTWATSATVANQAGRIGGGCSTGTHLFTPLSDNPADNNTTNKTEKYNFSADTTAAGGTLVNSLFARNGAHGDAAASFVFNGRTWAADSTVVDKYTHSSDTSAAATATGNSRRTGGTMGNATYAYLFGGTGAGSGGRKYTMASQTDAAATALSYTPGTGGPASGSNTTKGLLAGGNASTGDTTTCVYTFSGDTNAAGTALGTARGYASAFCEAPGGLN